MGVSLVVCQHESRGARPPRVDQLTSPMTARRVPVVSTFAYTLLVKLPPGLVMPNRFCSTFHGTSSSFGNSSVGSFCASRTMGTLPQLGKGVSWFSWEMLLVATNAWKEEEEGEG